MNSKENKKLIIIIIILIIFLIIGIILGYSIITKDNENNKISINESTEEAEINNNILNAEKQKKELGWELTLANAEHKIPEDYKFELENIDDTRKFDSRAIEYLKNMMNDIRKAGISNIWVQSSYRSIEDQTRIYNREMQKHINQGKTEEEAKKLTEEVIMIPGCSDHNLGLAVDFNDAETTFEDTKAFEWLTQNAEKYGFILRYPKDKENITKVTYEPWHWRYVGEKSAKQMNELGMCLEEYVEYIAY